MSNEQKPHNEDRDHDETALTAIIAGLSQLMDDRVQPSPTAPATWDAVPGLHNLYAAFLEVRQAVVALATGDLTSPIARRGFVAGALKGLQANLRHLTWQTKMIADGDYTQRVAYMGEFSTAFNAMVERLAASHQQLAEQNVALSLEITRRKSVEIAEREERLFAETLNRVGVVLSSSLDLDQVLDSILDLIGQVIPYDRAFLLLIDGEQARLVRQRGHGDNRLTDQQGAEPALSLAGDHPLRALRETRQAMLLDPLPSSWTNLLFGDAAPMQAMLGAPILMQDTVRGFLVLESAAPAFYQTPHTERLAAFAVQAALAMQNASLFRDIHRVATIDMLTGIFNRRHLFEAGTIEVLKAQRYSEPLSCIMLDIDHFKRVNDTFGHRMGDEVLKAVATACMTELRGFDIVGRYGGEEFVMLLPQTNVDGACATAERLRRIVADLVINYDGQQATVTISLGVSGLAGDQATTTLSTIIDQADQAMYAAKHAGRNRCICFDDSVRL